MKILLLGIKTNVLDEGAKNVATNLSAALARRCEILMIHQRQALSPQKIAEARRFGPDLILSIHGPSPKTVFVVAILRALCRGSRATMIGTQPHGGKRLLRWLKWTRIDLLLTQSSQWATACNRYHLSSAMLPNGVDTDKFRPVDPDRGIDALRASLALPERVRLALHIGPVNNNRGLDLLARLQRETDWQVVVIGSTTAPFVAELADRLRQDGILLRNEYFPHINEVYCAADVYIFPVMDPSGSIEYPLTVLEAMACDRPVLTAPFRGLPDLLPDAPAVRFFSDYDTLLAGLHDVIDRTGNRKAVLDLSWDRVADRFLSIVSEKLDIAQASPSPAARSH